ncbi:MAG: FKBP-type peptidyl-prolyl cis-trans isomerase [Sphingomicrobium sp.]
MRCGLIAASLLLTLSLGGCMTEPAAPSIDHTPLAFAAVRHVTTASGLAYHVVRKGPKTGRSPVAGETVTFDYEGKLLDGTVFDSSFARGTPISGAVGQFVPGFNEALKLMRPGDEWVVWIPPALGYGARATGPIPANSTLRFRMALRSVTPATP